MEINNSYKNKVAGLSSGIDEVDAPIQRIVTYEKALQKYEIDSLDWEFKFLGLLSDVAKAEDIKLHYTAKDRVQEISTVSGKMFIRTKIRFSGTFRGLIKTLNKIEKFQKVGKVTYVGFKNSIPAIENDTHPLDMDIEMVGLIY